ncbi:MAG: DUF4097 family beta strand repeat-containing protein [Gemmatimonadota bacterium]
MMKTTVAAGVLVTLGLVAAAGVERGQEGRDFEWSGHLDRGKVIEIKGVNGDIRAEAASGGDVEVKAVKRGRRSDESEVRIDVVEHADGVTICAVYPDRRRDRPNVCEPGRGGHLGSHNNDVEVTFTVKVPAGVRFTGKTVNGDVEANDLQADVMGTTVNGDVSVSTSGVARASTVNGSVSASFGRTDWDRDLEFSTVNGDVTLEMPAGANADVRASTVMGRMSTDFPLEVTGRFSNRRMRGRIGSGGRRLELKTVNGDIKLRKRG